MSTYIKNKYVILNIKPLRKCIGGEYYVIYLFFADDNNIYMLLNKFENSSFENLFGTY